MNAPPPPANRRYYLHRKLKKFMKVDAHKRIMMFQEDTFDNMTSTQMTSAAIRRSRI